MVDHWEEGDMLKISTFSKKIFTPMFWAFCCAIRRASSEMSQAVTFDSGSSAAKVQAIQPLPVPMSNMWSEECGVWSEDTIH